MSIVNKLFTQDTTKAEPVRIKDLNINTTNQEYICPFKFLSGTESVEGGKNAATINTNNIANTTLLFSSDSCLNMNRETASNIFNEEIIIENNEISKIYNKEQLISDRYIKLDAQQMEILEKLLFNSIIESSCINFYAFYDDTNFGASEVGKYFDIKRIFRENIINNEFIHESIHKYIFECIKIYDMNVKNICDFNLNKESSNFGKIKYNQGYLSLVDAYSSLITQAISVNISEAIHEGLSKILCDIVSPPNLEYIYSILENNSKELKEYRKTFPKTFGEYCTIFIERYFAEYLANFLNSCIRSNVYEILKEGFISSFNYIYYDIRYRMNEGNPLIDTER